MMNNVKYFCKKLLINFPGFTNDIKPDDMQPYMLFGDLGIYIRNKIDEDDISKEDLISIFSLLNEMGEANDDDVHNLLTVGVLEILTDSEKVKEISKQYLKGEALKNLDLIDNYWYGDK